MERGTVSMRVAFVLRSAEVQPLFRDLCDAAANMCDCACVWVCVYALHCITLLITPCLPCVCCQFTPPPSPKTIHSIYNLSILVGTLVHTGTLPLHNICIFKLKYTYSTTKTNHERFKMQNAFLTLPPLIITNQYQFNIGSLRLLGLGLGWTLIFSGISFRLLPPPLYFLYCS